MIKIISTSVYNRMMADLNDYHELKDAIEQAHQKSQMDCDVAFDFDAPSIVVYSIERVPTQGKELEHTLICWHDLKDGKRYNWCCWCGHDRHNELVAQFKKSKAKK